MSELNTQAQIIELTDDQLELVEGGSFERRVNETHMLPITLPLWIAGRGPAPYR